MGRLALCCTVPFVLVTHTTAAALSRPAAIVETTSGKAEPAPGCPHNCSGHGICSSMLVGCTCFSGFTGTGCELELAGQCTGNCSGHGWCLHGNLCACEEYWRGPSCSEPARCANGCSGFGRCVRDKCVCDATHEGIDCGIPRPSCPGWPLPCGGSDRGVCAGSTCKCKAAYSGAACELGIEEIACPASFNESGGLIDAICSDHGRCENEDGLSKGKCVCDPGWAGASCERPASQLPLATILLLIGLGVGAVILGLVGLLVWCVVVRGVVLRELLRGRVKRITTEEGWRQVDVDGQIPGARFERFFGDLNDFEAAQEQGRTKKEKKRSAAGGPR